MPTYEYQCEKCGKNFDYFQSMKDERLTICPQETCQQPTWGKGKVKRLMGTGAGVIFKGSGFYATDYRSSGYQAAAKNDTAPASTATPAATAPAPAATPGTASASDKK